MKLGATVDSKNVSDAFGVSEREAPYVAAITLTKLAGDAADAIVKKMPQVFDRPTDFTLRGVYTRGASKGNLVAEVYVPNSADAGGKSAREYMRPGALGASVRSQKKTEYLLTRLGALPAGWVTTPGKGAAYAIDGHGNLSGAVYKQIINVLQIRGDTKPVSVRSQKGAKRLGVQALFFVVVPGPNRSGKNGGWLPPGVWKHLPGGQITQFLKFVKRASYKKRLDIPQIANAAVAEKLPYRWRESALTIFQRFRKAR